MEAELKQANVRGKHSEMVRMKIWTRFGLSQENAQFCSRAFHAAGPTFSNSLADQLPTYSSDRFKLALKTFLFATY